MKMSFSCYSSPGRSETLPQRRRFPTLQVITPSPSNTNVSNDLPGRGIPIIDPIFHFGGHIFGDILDMFGLR